jgi:hypothetical protein
MQTGELVLVGSGSVSISLHHGKPDRTRVHFKDELIAVPCNASAPDQLDAEVVQNPDGSYSLIVEWSVSSAREVVWEADY